MIWDINLIMLFFAVGDVLLVSTELRTAILQITKTSVVEGETIEFKCMISAVHREQPNKERNWFHLYKNREKVSSLPEPRGIAAITFINEDIRKNDAGNYTCMHGNQNPGDVKYISRGPPIYLNVQESPYSLVLQLDKQSVMEGMDVSFKCMIPVELRDTEQKNGSFHLYKDGSLVDSQTVPKSLPGATFSIKKVNRNDTGNYTCVYGKETIVNSANNKRSRPVYLDVTETRYSLVLQLDKQSVMEGMDVSFRCMIPVELRDTAQKDGSFHLYKDGSLVNSQPVPKSLPSATFSIKKVSRQDTGNYTCVYGKEMIANSANNKLSRPVYLDVTECLTSPTTTAKTQQNSSTESYGLGNDIRIFLSLGILLLLSAIVGEDFYSRQRMHHRENANGQ
ncbi:immunoglobulin superfamily member 1-like isoform X1 [Polyodon spathula]|uniref:immunoglobulin superfamily member 1-like isoform X1 n=1 Tax=Polyodon spathula TaxID=7913 RepID=UPI001B7E741C|nr:immunoglobulin superfamily member 1-like isoform X1 [Polyodon spathula]